MLVIILLNAVPGMHDATVLEPFTTFHECQSESSRVGYEMAEAHPYERDFEIACRLNPRQQLCAKRLNTCTRTYCEKNIILNVRT
jgi:hypothetical protein